MNYSLLHWEKNVLNFNKYLFEYVANWMFTKYKHAFIWNKNYWLNLFPPANSFLTKKISKLTIPAEASLLSLDIIPLFTSNVPIDLVLDEISNRWYLTKKY